MYLLVIKRSKNLFEDEKIQQNVFTCLCEEGEKKEVELLDYAYAMCASHFVIQRSWIFVSHF